jgi:hypothetical protein
MTHRQRALFMAWIIPMIFILLRPYSVIDLAGWIAHGRYFLDHHELLRNDIFSVLPTAPLVYPSWSISIIYAWIYRLGGLTTVCMAHFLLLMVLLQIIYSHSIATLSNPTNRIARFSTYAFWLGVAALFGERPSTVALLPLLLAFLEISKIKKLSDIRPNLVFNLCFINIVWVNLHGSFILLSLMFAWKAFFLLVGERKMAGFLKSAIALICIVASSLLNPFTYQVFPYILETMQKSRGRMILEWNSTTPFASIPTGPLYFLLVIAVVVVLARRVGKPGFWSFLSSPFFLLMLNGFSAVRNAALAFVVLLPAMKQEGFLDREDKAPAQDLPKLSNIYKVAPFVLLLILSLPALKARALFFIPEEKRAVFDNSVLFKTAETIRATGKTCPIFNDWKVGSFLMLTLPNKIFVDSRNIIYSDEDFKNYVDALKAKPNWESYLSTHHACFAVLDKEYSSELIAALQSNKGWHSLGEENGYAVFER